MHVRFYILFLILIAALSLKGKAGGSLYAQDTVSAQAEISQNANAADSYLSARINALKKCSKHTAHIQRNLLLKLSHKEHSLTGLSGKSDSLSESGYSKHSIDFDSLQRLANNPSSLYNKGSPKVNKLIDSLKGIQSFIQQQSGRLQHAGNLTTSQAGLSGDYSTKIGQLQQQLNAQQQLQQLIEQRSSELQQLFPGKDIQALSAIKKQIAIAKSKTQSWKHVADDLDATEEKAYEFLQGIKGFNNYLNTDDKAFGGLGNNPSLADLQRMGYQTKGMVGKALQNQFGNNLDKVQQQMSGEIAAYQSKLSEVSSEAKDARSLYSGTKNEALSLSHSLNAEKPAFRNPMRGIPFLLRWQPGYDFQTLKAIDNRPAMLSFSASLAYKQTPKLKMGLGIAADLGLGKDWQHLRLSYEGISLRAFVDYDILWQIAIEGGYERSFCPAGRPYLQGDGGSNAETDNDIIRKTFGVQQQAAYLGLKKSYRLNKKWNGTFIIGYNFLWQQYGLRTPLMIRIGWEK